MPLPGCEIELLRPEQLLQLGISKEKKQGEENAETLKAEMLTSEEREAFDKARLAMRSACRPTGISRGPPGRNMLGAALRGLAPPGLYSVAHWAQ